MKYIMHENFELKKFVFNQEWFNKLNEMIHLQRLFYYNTPLYVALKIYMKDI